MYVGAASRLPASVPRNHNCPSMKGQVFYPASVFDQAILKEGVRKASQCLGVPLSCPEIPPPQYYSAGTPEIRSLLVRTALDDRNAEIMWAARGGYGSVEWLKDMPSDPSAWEGKKVIGYSDLTSLHAFLSNIGVLSYHGPMVATKNWLKASKAELGSLALALQGKSVPLSYRGEINFKGRLLGGNLTVLASLMGTPWQLSLMPGDIILLEDIGEAHYALARSLHQLSYSPNFSECTIIWGHITHCFHSLESNLALLQTLMEPYANQWGWGVLAGHEQPNMTLRLGGRVSGTEGELRFH